jgi:hypothetical protein
MGELQRSMANLQEVMVWLEKGWGKLSTAAGRGCGGVVPRVLRGEETEEVKYNYTSE